VLPLGGVNTDVVIDALNRSKGELRRSVNKAVTLRFSPELKFLADKSFDQMDETNRLLDLENVRRDLDRD
jgi:ribosome-binding factor A